MAPSIRRNSSTARGGSSTEKPEKRRWTTKESVKRGDAKFAAAQAKVAAKADTEQTSKTMKKKRTPPLLEKGDEKDGTSPEMKSQIEAKREYNRICAARSRAKRKQTLEDLRRKVDEAKNQCQELQKMNATLRSEIQEFMAEDEDSSLPDFKQMPMPESNDLQERIQEVPTNKFQRQAIDRAQEVEQHQSYLINRIVQLINDLAESSGLHRSENEILRKQVMEYVSLAAANSTNRTEIKQQDHGPSLMNPGFHQVTADPEHALIQDRASHEEHLRTNTMSLQDMVSQSAISNIQLTPQQYAQGNNQSPIYRGNGGNKRPIEEVDSAISVEQPRTHHEPSGILCLQPAYETQTRHSMSQGYAEGRQGGEIRTARNSNAHPGFQTCPPPRSDIQALDSALTPASRVQQYTSVLELLRQVQSTMKEKQK